jgi:acyl-coenzyme A thioesterase PaaI-like protein
MTRPSVRDRVLRAIAMNRIPGFHFCGHFLDVGFHRADPDRSRVSLEVGPLVADIDGSAQMGVLAFLADIALSGSIRAGLDPAVRLATVAMHLQFTGERATQRLEAAGEFQGFLSGAAGRQGLSRVALRSAGRTVGYGNGAFMVLDPPSGVTLLPLIQDRSRAPALAERDLTRAELAILRSAQSAAEEADERVPFIRRFWGYEPKRTPTGATCTMKNGGHVGNRVGHVQGGILVGLAAASASAALPASWRLSAIAACFVGPGEGAMLRARSRIVHHGRQTAVVRTEVTGASRRRVLEVTSTHALAIT